MILFDVNVLLLAMREDRPEFEQANALLLQYLLGTEPVAWHPMLGASILRIATNRKLPGTPSSIQECLNFIHDVRSAPVAVEISEGPDFWQTFEGLLKKYKLTGNEIPDAYLAALAMSHDAELISADRGFRRIQELRFREAVFTQ